MKGQQNLSVPVLFQNPQLWWTKELGEPFRRDAMKTPVQVAGIDPADMQPQQVD